MRTSISKSKDSLKSSPRCEITPTIITEAMEIAMVEETTITVTEGATEVTMGHMVDMARIPTRIDKSFMAMTGSMSLRSQLRTNL